MNIIEQIKALFSKKTWSSSDANVSAQKILLGDANAEPSGTIGMNDLASVLGVIGLKSSEISVHTDIRSWEKNFLLSANCGGGVNQTTRLEADVLAFGNCQLIVFKEEGNDTIHVRVRVFRNGSWSPDFVLA